MGEENIIRKISSAVDSAKRPGICPRFLAAISYLGVLCLAPIMLKVKNDYVRFHARQGFLLFVAEIVFILIWVVPFIGVIIGSIGWIVCFVLSLIGLVNGIIGREWKMPILHKFANKVKFQF